MTEHSSYTIPGVKVLLEGESGTGKTDVLTTLVAAGLKPFIIFTESSMGIIAKSCKRRGLDMDQIQWKYIAPATASWDALSKTASQINTLSFEGLCKIQDTNRIQYNQWAQVLATCANFISDKDGKNYGDVTTWGTDRVLIIDGLTNLSTMAMTLLVGGRPTRAQSDWLVTQNNLENFLDTIIHNTQCHFCLLAHLEPEKNEVTGGIQLYASTLGKKLAPKLPAKFDEVIHAVRNGTEFLWSVATHNAILKSRYLPISEKLTASFVPMIESWKENGGIIQPTK